MKKITPFLVLLFAIQHIYAQDYIDVLKVMYTSTQINREPESEKAQLRSFDASFLTPVPVAPSTYLLLGGDFNIRSLPVNNVGEISTFYNSMLRLGISTKFNDSWNGYLIALPKFAGDYDANFGSSFLIGGLAMLRNKKRENLSWKMGLYSSQEAYGIFAMPIVGVFYRSPNERLTLDFSIPLIADANYALTARKTTSVGVDFIAFSRSFFWGPNTPNQNYAENNEISFAGYFQHAALDSKLLLRLKAGYSAIEFGQYAVQDDKMFRLPLLNIGDNRTRLNREISGGAQVKVEAVIRLGRIR